MTSGEPHADGRISTERHGRVLAIGIDRPRKLNGFSAKMLGELAAAFTLLEGDDDAWVGLLYAHGANFTAGLELDKVAALLAQRAGIAPAGSVDPLSLRPPLRTKPLVCAVQGICFTIGIELMLAADIVVAAADCRFAQIEVKRGIMPAGGATGQQQQRALEIAERIAAQAPLAVRASLASSRIFLAHGPEAAIRQFHAEQARLMATADAAEGVRSFTERRAGRFTGR